VTELLKAQIEVDVYKREEHKEHQIWLRKPKSRMTGFKQLVRAGTYQRRIGQERITSD
jgi:hypothetical protein